MNEVDRLEGRNGRIWVAYTRGMTQQAIAEQYGISQTRVSYIIKEVRESIPTETRDEIVKERIEQLRRIRFSLSEAAEDGDQDAIKSLLAIHQRESKLLGLDAVVKSEVDTTVRYEIVGVDPDEIV